MATSCNAQNGIARTRPHTNVLGVDGEGYTHVHKYAEGVVLVIDDGDVVRTQDLDGRSVWEWIEYVEAEHGEWDELRYSRLGLGGLVKDIVEGLSHEHEEK